MFERELAFELKSLMEDYPIVTVVGPRQSGKTTLVKKAFPKLPYTSLEDPDTRALAAADPRGFLERFSDGAIFDEIQRLPELLSYIQTLVDAKDKKGLFVLTGSHQLALHEAISQSLAGRTALLELLPMSLRECSKAGIELDLDGACLMGGYPRIHKDQLDPTKAYRNYFQTYVERDVRQLIQIKNLAQFEQFIRICAGRTGQILNLTEIGGQVGISSHTASEWISLLEASFIVFRLYPYHKNFGKRLIKAPKLYFTDVGLATYLLGIENKTQLMRDPLRGHLVENLVILEMMKARTNQGLDPNLYFYRDIQKNEVDALFISSGNPIPVEIKSSKTFHPEFLTSIKRFQRIAKTTKGFVVYGGSAEQTIGEIDLISFNNASSIIKSD